MASSSPAGPAHFALVEHRNWGGPDLVAYELVLGLDLLDGETADSLLRSARALAAALGDSLPEPIRVSEGLLPRRRVTIAIPVKDEAAGIDCAPDDPRLLHAALSVEAGLADALRSAPISVNGRFLTPPEIPFKPGDAVELRIPAYEGLRLTVLRVDPETGNLGIEARGHVLGKALRMEMEAYFRDVFPLGSPP